MKEKYRLTDRKLTIKQIATETGLAENSISMRIARYGADSPLVAFPGDLHSIPARDHLGNEFPSLKEMARYWKVSYPAFLNRLKKGWLVGEALTVPADKRGRRFRFTDHRGNVFHSRDEILEFWHISRGRFYAKKAQGFTDEEILREQEARLEDKKS